MKEKTDIVKTLVKPEDIPHIWVFAEKLLKKSAKRSEGRTNTNDLFEECMAGTSSLWIVYEQEKFPELLGCGITQINHYPTGLKMLNIDHVAGVHQEKWTKGALDVLERFAKDVNCDGIESLGRPGFWSWIKNDNWSRMAVAYQKRFDNEK
ncbi:MAG: hypothetical protein GOVbin2604_49 [Gammaproteobacteria virus GOV_bin_2604]|nr:MAG: hypothetical protein GOVbin2604_49 [Gammaproteobacteria virus GOV_bin_2604]|tara:strand:- start:15 stop:467 length:453 start_codon:yes stop_codon:yes gene_type:complete